MEVEEVKNKISSNQSQTLPSQPLRTLRAADEASDGQSDLAGRELDAAVAERVMGWSRVPNATWWRTPYAQDVVEPPAFSSSIATAMEVVEKMRQRGYGWSILTHRDGWFVRCFELPDESFNWRHSTRVNQSLAFAVCETALLALEETAEADRQCGRTPKIQDSNTRSGTTAQGGV